MLLKNQKTFLRQKTGYYKALTMETPSVNVTEMPPYGKVHPINN